MMFGPSLLQVLFRLLCFCLLLPALSYGVFKVAVIVPVPSVKFEPTPVPRVRYSTSTPIPAPRKVITPAPPKTPKPRDFEELRSTYIKKINEMFDTLSERFHQLDV